MTLQTNLFTDFQVHSKENNAESEAILRANKPRFSLQCKALYSSLMSGESITTTKALYPGIRYGNATIQIGDARRRFKDLKDAGVSISEVLNENRFKTWSMSNSDRIKNINAFGSEL